MFPSNGMIVLAILIVGGIAWCVFIVRRLPSDLAELREQLAKYRASRTLEVLSQFRTVEQRRGFQRECATDFWTTLGVHLCFFWPVTVLIVTFFLLPAIWVIVANAVRALDALR